MIPGGITEVIWHFAGYFHLASEYAKALVIYDDGPAKRPIEDYTTPRPDDTNTGDLDPFTTLRAQLPSAEPLADFVSHHLPLLKGLKVTFPSPSEFDAEATLAKLTPAHSGGGGGGGAFKITVMYDDDAAQTQLEINQLNRMDDDDELMVGDRDAIRALQHPDIAGTLEAMADQANNEVPAEYRFPQGTSEISEFLSALDQERAGGDGPPDGHSIEPGRYVNGELDESEVPPAAEAPPPVDLGTEAGQWALGGGNVAINATLIMDLGESARSMIVMGDYSKTNLFVQTNSYADNDAIAVSGGFTAGGIISSDNVADNIATFNQQPGLYAELPATFAGPNWKVDVVTGDYYDIHLIVQQNYLLDNDIVVQDSRDAHYEIHAGGNEQINLTELLSGGFKYDLIIIAGSYHGANIIYQHNILLDSDVIKSASADTVDASSSLDAGQNELLNSATIAIYGENSFPEWNVELEDLVSLISSGAGTLDPSFGLLLDGNGGTFDVLYVTGDYYDINAIWQVNVTADADVILQVMTEPPSFPDGTTADQTDGETVTRSIASGENSLTNEAAIIDVGSTDAFVNGEIYVDTVLIQAKLIEEDDDQVVIHDTDTLVSELVAFATPTEDETNLPPPTFVAIPQDDPMANVMH